MIGGVLVNFLLALFIYSMIMFVWGDTYYQVKDMNMGMKFNNEAKALGFHDHDILIGTNKGAFKDFGADLFRDISTAEYVDVKRDGKAVRIPIKEGLNLLNMLKADPAFVRPFVPAKIKDVTKDSPASEVGIKAGDVILAVNGKNIDSWNEFGTEMGRIEDIMTQAQTPADSLKVRTATFVVKHQNAAKPDTLTTVLTSDLKLGIYQTSIADYYTPKTDEFGFLESFPAGVKYGWNVLKGYVSDMQYVFTADGAKSLGGFGAIGSLFPPTWDWYMFWKMTAFLSIILAFMNILPIPALDGGHVLFLLYEIITRRKPSETFMIRAEYVGVTLLILLMVVANLNDILRALGLM